jgi:endonuclease/exonuclease/phosphatase family metal-dependent hydrolase
MNESATPTIWSEYISYLQSGQRYRIPFDTAAGAWDMDAARWEHRNTYIPANAPGLHRIASWNVHQWKHADGTSVPIEKLRADIESINADVLCLQEFSKVPGVQKILADMYPYSFVEMVTDSGGGFGNVIYSKVPMSNKRIIELPGDIERRICQHVTVKDTHIFNTHLEVRNNYPRIHSHRYPQINAIITEMQSLPDDARVVLCGDFNVGWSSVQDKDFHRTLMKAGYKNVGAWARRRAGAMQIGDHGAHITNMVRNSSMYGGFIDHIYVLNVAPIGFYELFTNTSDHYPIITDLRSGKQ